MLEKIKEFFRNIFVTNNQNYLDAPKAENELFNINNIEKQNNEFEQNLKIIPNQEEERILKLQKDFKAGIVEEEDLSKEDFESLTKLYENQIQKTKQSIEKYKARIVAVKSKLAQDN